METNNVPDELKPPVPVDQLKEEEDNGNEKGTPIHSVPSGSGSDNEEDESSRNEEEEEEEEHLDGAKKERRGSTGPSDDPDAPPEIMAYLRRGRRSQIYAPPVQLEEGWKPRVIEKDSESKKR